MVEELRFGASYASDNVSFQNKRSCHIIILTPGMGDTIASMSREQGFLETYFSTLSQFNYDKAKEIADKERDAFRTHVGTAWHTVLNALGQLALAEKVYMFLGFLATKSFLRKDTSLKGSYEAVRAELHKVENPGKTSPQDSLDSLLEKICGQLVHFIYARLELIDVYEKLFNMGQTRTGNCDEINVQISSFMKYGRTHLHHPTLNHLQTGFSYECEILIELLSAELQMEQWSFMPALFHLYTAHGKLGSWSNLFQPRESRRLSFSPSGFLKQPQLPYLYQWLVRLKGYLVSKFTFYFHEVLSKQTAPPEMKNLCSKAPVDFYQKVVSFQRKLDVISICLIFDARRCSNYQGHGYHLPSNVREVPQGLDCFPAILCYPAGKPSSHWPSIIITMEDKTHELNLPDRVVCVYDKQISCTYIIVRVDVRMTLAIILNNKRSEKESYIATFIDDVCTQLRFYKILSALRPGYK